MSGPALKQMDAHRAIHDAAAEEAAELTELLRHLLQAQAWEKAEEMAYILVEHWQTRTLRHAGEEEAGFYLEVCQHHPEKAGDIAALTRDHDLMRTLVAEIEARLAAWNATENRTVLDDPDTWSGLLSRFETLNWLVVMHSREEERRLLETQVCEEVLLV
ncbi:MAG: hemerythrin domain-containing protein [Alicyclobacillus herbarius]|uniref:hemerythrin domain-containing protein n=1 Tax=Alicyclobacillus herbarius TaxID=122960 RepID=UPI00040FA50E|nr:hemerythrin domain-containing protein [Alicyclobacillus herbarius]MCL6632063.1 hemerythrin domain-containing protein [Alicyclobacillus herbarius]